MPGAPRLLAGCGLLAAVALSAPAWFPAAPEPSTDAQAAVRRGPAPGAGQGVKPLPPGSNQGAKTFAPVSNQPAPFTTASRDLDRRLAALESDLRPFATEVALRTLFRRAQIELRLATAAAERGQPRAAVAALARAAADVTAAEEAVAARTARLRDPGVQARWQRWADAAVAASRSAGAAVVVDKLGHRCLLLVRGRTVASFPAELGRNALADKLYAGDAATPEGVYRVLEKREEGATIWYRALLLDYPTAEDRREFAAARRAGLVPRGRGVGGLIEIHGHGGRGSDWTNGCVALRNPDMDALYDRLPLGAQVAIVGTARLPPLTAVAAADAATARGPR